jgi:hypothetical protein
MSYRENRRGQWVETHTGFGVRVGFLARCEKLLVKSALGDRSKALGQE